MGFVARVDRSADLGHPQGNVEVLEQREGLVELAVVEDALRFSDHDGVEAALGVLELPEQT
nr:hypothetical protein [Nocardiopsis chromatogenes]